MMRKLLIGLGLLLCATQTAQTTWAAKKNVVLFVTDDQSPDAGCYGNKVIQTPNLDQLASQGVRLTHAFCTTASCSASRSVILSGLYNHANGHYGHQHAYHHFSSFDNVKSLPVLLAAGGYRTARMGKYHVAPEEVYKFQKALPGNARSPVEMADNCQEFISENSTKPFFLYFCTADPHRSGKYAEDTAEKPNLFGNEREYPGITEVKYNPKDVIVPPFLPDTPTCRAEIAQYYQSISRIDQGLGRLIQVLKDAGVYEDTLIIYTSDHGMAFPGGKTTLYEGGMRVPFVVRNPYLERKNEVCNALVTLCDLTPTILDFAGLLPAQSPHQGRSFLNALDQTDPTGWDEVQASHTFHEITMYYPMRVVRNRRYKLIWNIAHPLPFPFASDLWAAPTWQAAFQQGPKTMYGQRTVEQYIHRPKFELFDLQNDPNEAKNLADDPNYASILKEMQGKLQTFQKKTKDPWISKWEYE